jgi:hypothetical protein
MRCLVLLALPLGLLACYPTYTKMAPAVPPATLKHPMVVAAPAYTAGPSERTTRTPEVLPPW